MVTATIGNILLVALVVTMPAAVTVAWVAEGPCAVGGSSIGPKRVSVEACGMDRCRTEVAEVFPECPGRAPAGLPPRAEWEAGLCPPGEQYSIRDMGGVREGGCVPEAGDAPAPEPDPIEDSPDPSPPPPPPRTR